MNEVLTPRNSLDEDNIDVRKELDSLREALKDAISESRQSSAFCQRIQNDIKEFVRTEELTRSKNEEFFDNVELIRLVKTSVDDHLSAFESFIIGRVREQLQCNSGNDISEQLDSLALQVQKLHSQQMEQAGKLDALVSEAAYRQTSIRREMKNFANKLWNDIIAMKEEMRTQSINYIPNHNESENLETKLPIFAREMLNVLTALSSGLEADRLANDKDRKWWFTLMEKMVEKIKLLENREDELVTELIELRQVTEENRKCYQKIVDCVIDLGSRIDQIDSVLKQVSSKDKSDTKCECISEKVENKIEELKKEFIKIDSIVKSLQMKHTHYDGTLKRNAMDIEELQKICGELSVGTKEVLKKIECVSEESHNHSHFPHQSIYNDNQVNDTFLISQEENIVTSKQDKSHMSCKLASSVALNFLQRKIYFNIRSYAFQTWLAWTRGRIQLNRDKTMLRLFTKQRNQLNDVGVLLHKLQENLQKDA